MQDQLKKCFDLNPDCDGRAVVQGVDQMIQLAKDVSLPP